MKILFLSRIDLYNPRGGDTIQMEKTKEAIEKLYPDVHIDIVTELAPKNIDEYDIVHVFNLDWVCESYLEVLNAKKHSKKVVVSAIHHSEDEVKLYEEKAPYDIRRIYNFLIRSQSMRDMWKNAYRSLFVPQKIYPTYVQFIRGIRNTQRDIIKAADVILVQTEAEAISIKKDFGIKDFRYRKVVNGVDTELFSNTSPDIFNRYILDKFKIDISNSRLMLNVGRVEPRKNQLIIMDLFKELTQKGQVKDTKLIFIGAMTTKSWEYKFRFLRRVKDNNDILYLGGLSQELVASAMSHKGIYIHPSWFETTGLVCLEALLAGMQVITSSTRLSEYIDKGIKYCAPTDSGCLKDAILESVKDESQSQDIARNIRQNYSWANTAHQTVSVYKELLNS